MPVICGIRLGKLFQEGFVWIEGIHGGGSMQITPSAALCVKLIGSKYSSPIYCNWSRMISVRSLENKDLLLLEEVIFAVGL